jgi:hypothetical protein
VPRLSSARFATPLLLLAIAACQMPALTQTPESQIISGNLLGKMTPGTVSGSVTAPIIAVGAGNIIAVGAGNIIAVGAGNIIAVGAGNYRTLDTSTSDFNELPVSGATVVLRDAATLDIMPGVQATTDNQGHFSVSGVPAGINFLVEVVGTSKDGSKAFHLTGFAPAQDNGAPATPINQDSTLAAAKLHDLGMKAGRIQERLYVMTSDKIQKVEDAIATTLAKATDTNRRLAAAGLALSMSNGRVSVPTTLGQTALQQASSAFDALAQADATLLQAWAPMDTTMSSGLTAEEQTRVGRFRHPAKAGTFVPPSPAPVPNPTPIPSPSQAAGTPGAVSPQPSPTPSAGFTLGTTNVASAASGAHITGVLGLNGNTGLFSIPFSGFDKGTTTGMPTFDNSNLTSGAVVWGRSMFAKPTLIGQLSLNTWNYNSATTVSGATAAAPQIVLGFIDSDGHTVHTWYDTASHPIQANTSISAVFQTPQLATGMFIWAKPSNGGSVTFTDVEALQAIPATAATSL